MKEAEIAGSLLELADKIDRHGLGFEGWEDSPAHGWAEELRGMAHDVAGALGNLRADNLRLRARADERTSVILGQRARIIDLMSKAEGGDRDGVPVERGDVVYDAFANDPTPLTVEELLAGATGENLRSLVYDERSGFMWQVPLGALTHERPSIKDTKDAKDAIKDSVPNPSSDVLNDEDSWDRWCRDYYARTQSDEAMYLRAKRLMGVDE